MTREEIEDWISEVALGEEVLLADGLDEAFIGLSHAKCAAVYDCEKCSWALMKRDGLTYEEAAEYLEFNTFCAHVGDKTPVFVYVAYPRDPNDI